MILDDVVLKVVSALTVEDVEKMKRAGLDREAKWLVSILERTMLRFCERGPVEEGTWPIAHAKLSDVRSLLLDSS